MRPKYTPEEFHLEYGTPNRLATYARRIAAVAATAIVIAAAGFAGSRGESQPDGTAPEPMPPAGAKPGE